MNPIFGVHPNLNAVRYGQHDPMTRAAIFDVDGTLIDSVHEHTLAWQEAFKLFGHEIGYRRIRLQIGKGGDLLVRVFLPDKLARKQGPQIEVARMTIFRIRYMNRLRAFPRVRALILKLRAQDWKVALASSAKKEELKIYKRICQIEHLLDAEISDDDVNRSKPNPNIFKVAARKLGDLAPARCVVIGDSPFDAIGAFKAHMPAVGFLSGGSSQKKLLDAGAKYIYRDAADLLRNFDRSIFIEKKPSP